MEEESASALMNILYEERARCLAAKAVVAEDGKDYYRSRLRSITRIWKETARMMDELGWSRPNGYDDDD